MMKSVQRVRRQKATFGARGQRSCGNDDGYPRVVSDTPMPSIELPPTPPADSQSPQSNPGLNRKRHCAGENPRAYSRHRTRLSTPYSTPECETETILDVKCVDRTFQYDEYDVEEIPMDACLPWLQRELDGSYPHPTDRSKINKGILKPPVADLVFPDVRDDEPEMVEFVTTVRKKSKGSRSKRARRRKEPSEIHELHESDDEEEHPALDSTEVPVQVEQPKPASKPIYDPNPWERQNLAPLMSQLPLEIRRIIWRGLLVAPTPVLVHSNWGKIYQRKKASISTQLMIVCHAIYQEALPILYGENTFCYLIRDTANSTATIANVSHPALTAGHPGGIEDGQDAEDSGSDWERDQVPARGRRKQTFTTRKTRSAGRQEKHAMDFDINVEKFAHLFRHLMVEAEAPRYEQEIQDRMAQAIEVFKLRLGGDETPRGEVKRLSIRTLTIRVTPSRQSASVHGYTFIDFFESGSAVINAVKSLDCLCFRIEISREVLDTSCATNTCQEGRGITPIELQFPYQRLAYNIYKFHARDMWASGALTRQRRAQAIQREINRLEGITEEMKTACQLMDDRNSQDVAESVEAQHNFADAAEGGDEDFDAIEAGLEG